MKNPSKFTGLFMLLITALTALISIGGITYVQRNQDQLVSRLERKMENEVIVATYVSRTDEAYYFEKDSDNIIIDQLTLKEDLIIGENYKLYKYKNKDSQFRFSKDKDRGYRYEATSEDVSVHEYSKDKVADSSSKLYMVLGAAAVPSIFMFVMTLVNRSRVRKTMESSKDYDDIKGNI